MNSSVIEVLLELRSKDIRVWAQDGELRFAAPSGVDEPTRVMLQRRAGEIVSYLADSDDCDATTLYLTVRDGGRLAVDLFRPKRNGTLVAEPVPAVWCLDRYHRSKRTAGLVRTKLDSRPWLRTVMRHGYAVAAVDARGTGASTGSRATEFGQQETKDAFDITEWLAAQPWCSGAVGMYGDSYLAIAQLLTAGAAPPHLRAIVPHMPLFDLYDFLYPGGVFRDDFAREWSKVVRRLDLGTDAAPVDGHESVGRLAAAEHRANHDPLAAGAAHPHRDSRDPASGLPFYQTVSPVTFLGEIDKSQVAVCLISGWYDIWVRDALLWLANLTNPRQLIVGASCHTGRGDIDLAEVHLRWFDRWLKDADNGVPCDGLVRYRIMNSRTADAWAVSRTWPPAMSECVPFFFGAGNSGTAGSVNDGRLLAEPAGGSDEWDDYQVDYAATSGRGSRWSNGYGNDFGYGPMSENDRHGLTYTTEPLQRDTEVTGHPVAHLFVTSSHPDGDFFVYLEEVDEGGDSRYVTEGVLRASCRRTAPAPYQNLGLPFHPCTGEGREDLSSLPTELVFDLHPTSYLFHAGRRIRVTVTGCDADNAQTPRHTPSPFIQVHRSRKTQSRIDLPVMTRKEEAGEP